MEVSCGIIESHRDDNEGTTKMTNMTTADTLPTKSYSNGTRTVTAGFDASNGTYWVESSEDDVDDSPRMFAMDDWKNTLSSLAELGYVEV